MLPEILRQILSDASNEASSQASLDSENGQAYDHRVLVDGVDFNNHTILEVFNNPDLLSKVAAFVPDPQTHHSLFPPPLAPGTRPDAPRGWNKPKARPFVTANIRRFAAKSIASPSMHPCSTEKQATTQ